METNVAFSKVFQIEVPIMEGPGFKLVADRGRLYVNNPEKLEEGLLKDLNDAEFAPMAMEVINLINNHGGVYVRA